jgi:hypothetical protein
MMHRGLDTLDSYGASIAALRADLNSVKQAMIDQLDFRNRETVAVDRTLADHETRLRADREVLTTHAARLTGNETRILSLEQTGRTRPARP